MLQIPKGFHGTKCSILLERIAGRKLFEGFFYMEGRSVFFPLIKSNKI